MQNWWTPDGLGIIIYYMIEVLLIIFVVLGLIYINKRAEIRRQHNIKSKSKLDRILDVIFIVVIKPVKILKKIYQEFYSEIMGLMGSLIFLVLGGMALIFALSSRDHENFSVFIVIGGCAAAGMVYVGGKLLFDVILDAIKKFKK